HRQRSVVPTESRMLGSVANAERDEQTEGGQRRPLRREARAELLERGTDAGLRGAEGNTELGRDLLVREVAGEVQPDRVALRCGQLVDRRAYDPPPLLRRRCLGWPGILRRQAREQLTLRVGLDRGLPAPAAELVQHAGSPATTPRAARWIGRSSSRGPGYRLSRAAGQCASRNSRGLTGLPSTSTS